MKLQARHRNRRFGIDRFVEACKERVATTFAAHADRAVDPPGLLDGLDWDNSYFTMSEENNYTIWAFLKKCHEQGLVYRGYDAMPWCPRCGVGISADGDARGLPES